MNVSQLSGDGEQTQMPPLAWGSSCPKAASVFSLATRWAAPRKGAAPFLVKTNPAMGCCQEELTRPSWAPNLSCCQAAAGQGASAQRKPAPDQGCSQGTLHHGAHRGPWGREMRASLIKQSYMEYICLFISDHNSWMYFTSESILSSLCIDPCSRKMCHS